MNLIKKYNVDFYRLAAVLLYNALRFRICKAISEPLKPAALSLAVTNRCNSHCIMCNIWKSAGDTPNLKSLELPRRKIVNILNNRLFSELVELDLTGGEPHLRDDLADIVLGIASLKRNALPRLRSIIITSNGFLTRQVISNYKKMLLSLKDTNIDLVAVISLDGMGDIHDRIRGTTGAFELASKTLEGLFELRKEHPNFILGVKTTILHQNIDVLESVLNFALTNDCFHIISPVIFTGARFKNLNRKDEISLTPSDYKKILDFYRRDELKTSYFYTRGLDYLATGEKHWVCTASYNYMFIDYDGKVYPCEIVPDVIGDVNNQDIRDIWHSPRARGWRKKMGDSECCRICHEPGAIRYSAIAEGNRYREFLMGLGRHNYNGSLRREGYAKYLYHMVS